VSRKPRVFPRGKPRNQREAIQCLMRAAATIRLNEKRSLAASRFKQAFALVRIVPRFGLTPASLGVTERRLGVNKRRGIRGHSYRASSHSRNPHNAIDSLDSGGYVSITSPSLLMTILIVARSSDPEVAQATPTLPSPWSGGGFEE
jgi:hypothetical protein